ncbi:MAG: TonB-dependent receptor, partial [Candidatus Cloacimonetes bacterium]|nr:TonB-dependent receptor [Candidatus Cloacimonadota bacterium]
MLISFISAETISGNVTNSSNGQPIEFASITLQGTSVGTSSNQKGYYVLTDVKPGIYEIFVSHISYKTESRIITVKENESAYLNIELSQRSIQMEDVFVVSEKNSQEVNTREIQISRVSRTPKQLLDVVPMVEPDIVRSLLTLPGVTPIADFSSGMYVRGGSPDQNQILLDNIEVYNPTHFGGLFSTFNVDAIDNVELLKGGFPAKYGGRLSSVLDIRNLDGNRKSHHGIARLSLISAQVTAEGPWSISSQKGSYMGSFRRSYFDLITMAIDELPDYYFYDGHIKVNYDISNRDKVTASSYVGYDKLKWDIEEIDIGIDIGWGNRTFSSQWTHIFSPRWFSYFILANSYFESDISQKTSSGYMTRFNNIDDYTVKGVLNYTPNNYHLLDFGFDMKYNTVDFLNTTDMDIPKEQLVNVQVESITNDFYFQDSWIVNAFWTFQPGFRLSNYATTKINLPESPDGNYFRVSPRLSLRRKLDVDSNIYANYGKYYQFLAQIGPVISSPMDVWMPLDGTVSPSESDHYILGYKNNITEGLGFDIEFYYKDMKNIVDYNWDIEEEWDNNTMKLSDVVNVGKGHSYGFDVLLRTDNWGFAGFLGYSLGITKNKFQNTNLNPVTQKPKYFYPKHDRTHQINMVQAYNISEQTGRRLWGAEMILGATYTFATGQPAAVPEQVYYAGDHFGFIYSYKDAVRLPDYSRLDLSYKLLWQ